MVDLTTFTATFNMIMITEMMKELMIEKTRNVEGEQAMQAWGQTREDEWRR
jgi:hypothetical protein